MERSEWFQRFHNYIVNGYLQPLRILLEAKPEFVSVDEKCIIMHGGAISALEYLIRYRRTMETSREIMGLLLIYGADPLQEGRDGEYLVMCAFASGDEDLVIEFLYHVDDIETPILGQSTALHVSAYHLQKRSMEYCIRRGADINRTFDVGWTALHTVLSLSDIPSPSHVEIITFMLDNGADLTIPTLADGCTPIHAAAVYSNEDVLDVLLSRRPNMNIPDFDRKIPMLLFIYSPKFNLRIFERFLECGSDPNFPTKNERTCLHLLPECGLSDAMTAEVSELLVKYGADVNLRDIHGNTPLHCAVSNRKIFLMKNLIKNGVDISLGNNDGLPAPLLLPVARTHDQIAVLLIRKIVLQLHTNKLRKTKELDYFMSSTFRKIFTRRRCEMEIERAKSRKLGSTNISQFELLTSDVKKMWKYVRNQEIVNALEELVKVRSIIYNEEFQELLSEGLKRKNLEQVGWEFFSIIGVEFLQYGHEYIFEYLTNDDLEKLTEVVGLFQSSNR